MASSIKYLINEWNFANILWFNQPAAGFVAHASCTVNDESIVLKIHTAFMLVS